MAKSKKTHVRVYWTLSESKDDQLSFDVGFLITGSFPVCFTRLFGEQLRQMIEGCVSNYVDTYLGEHIFHSMTTNFDGIKDSKWKLPSTDIEIKEVSHD